jgi:hypothetical protein
MPSTGAYRSPGKGLRLMYPYRPVPDTPGPLSTNIRAGAEAAPQNDLSKQKLEGRLTFLLWRC